MGYPDSNGEPDSSGLMQYSTRPRSSSWICGLDDMPETDFYQSSSAFGQGGAGRAGGNGSIGTSSTHAFFHQEHGHKMSKTHSLTSFTTSSSSSGYRSSSSFQTRSRASTNATQPCATVTYTPTPLTHKNTFVDELVGSRPQKPVAETTISSVGVATEKYGGEYHYPCPWNEPKVWGWGEKKREGRDGGSRWRSLFKRWRKTGDELDFGKRYDIWVARQKEKQGGY